MSHYSRQHRGGGGAGGGGPPIPNRWLKCPRKSETLIAGKFLALKTPLDQRYDAQVPPQALFYPSMVFSSMRSYRVKIGLWIDLTNTDRFYDRRLVEEADGGNGSCRYLKINCRGHGETPSEDQVNKFVMECNRFIKQNPMDVIAVHCTHGFNRTGFLISAFLIQTEDWSPEAAVGAFAEARKPGIYKGDYIQELFRRYGDESDAPVPPELPDWCFEEEEEDDDVGGSSNGNGAGPSGSGGGGGGKRRGKEVNKKNPQFMPGVPGVRAVTDQPRLKQIQSRIQGLCHWGKSGFPGAQPVSMDVDNIAFLSQRPYKVSWKADGMRYMMLIDGKDQVFFADRDNCIFQVENLTFPARKEPDRHLTQTLLDGEMVIDEFNGERRPRYLVYDVIRFEGAEVGKTNFSTRLVCIEKEIIHAREVAMTQGRIDKNREPFSVRKKMFWPLNDTKTLLGPKFTKESLGHEPDGLVFQPSDDPYTPGRDDKILKWKPHTHNSIDFKLQVVRENRPGMLPETLGQLFVGGLREPFDVMRKLKKEVRALDNRIIECTFDTNKGTWVFMRERTDKSYPNAFSTAQGVMKSIRQPVTSEMLLDFIDRHQFRAPHPHPSQHHRPPPVGGGPMGPPSNKMPRIQ